MSDIEVGDFVHLLGKVVGRRRCVGIGRRRQWELKVEFSDGKLLWVTPSAISVDAPLRVGDGVSWNGKTVQQGTIFAIDHNVAWVRITDENHLTVPLAKLVRCA